MIIEQPFCHNFCDNFLSHIYIVVLISLSIDLIFVSIPMFVVYFDYLINCPKKWLFNISWDGGSSLMTILER